MANLGPQLIKNSYQDLVQITASNALAKGDGTSISNISVTSSWAINALSASFLTSTANTFVQGGNSFGTTALLGTNDNQNLQLETSGSVRVHISSSGNVGIGTTTPVHNLVVNGNTGVSINANGAIFPNIHRDSADGGMLLRSWDGSTFTNNVKITPTTAVGIGTTSPTQKLDVRDGFIQVSGSGASGQGITIARAGLDTYQFTHEDGGLTIKNSTDNVKEMSFGGNGNVGINFQSPLAKLHISGASALRLQNAGFDTFQWTFSSGTGIELRNVTDGTNPFYIGGTDNIGIGTTSPSSKLHISGANADALLRVSSPTNQNILFVSGSGNVGIGTTTPSTTLQVAGTSSLRNIIFDTDNTYDIGTITTRARNIWSNGIVVGTISYFNSAVMYNSARIGGEHTATALLHISGSDSAQMMRINSPTNPNILFVSGSGRVGIGTTTPTQRLDVRGNTIIAGTTPVNPIGGTLEVYNNGSNAQITIHEDSGSAEARLYFRTEGTDTIFRNLNTRFSIDTETKSDALTLSLGGNVGIGTTNPLSLLHISASSGNEFFRITSGSQNILNVRSGSVVWFAGTGVASNSGVDLDIQGTGTANGGSVRIAGNGTVWGFGSVSSVNRGGTGNSDMFNVTMGGTSATLVQNPMKIQFDASQSSTGGGGYTVLRLNATHATTAGTGSKLLQTWEFAGVQRSVVNITGSIGIGITTPSASVHISSSLGLAPILAITPHHPLPTTNIPTGSFMVSSSIPPKPFFWDGTTWNALY